MAQGKVIGAYGLTEPGAGQRLGRDADDRPPRGRARRRDVGHRRRQALHHERRPGRARTSSPPGPATATTASPRSPRSSSRPTRPGFSRRAARGQARPARLGDRRAAVRRRPGPGRQPARRAGERLQDVPRDPRRRADQHRRAGGRARPGRARRGDPVRADARAVRPADRLVPGRRVHDRRHGDRDRGRPGARLARRLAQGPGSRLRARRGPGEAVRVRGQLAGDERRDPGPRRLRLRRPTTRSSASCATRS